MLIFRLETSEEAKVILIFHVVGTVMEVFKTEVGSWVYPEASLLPHRRRAAVLRLHVCLDRQLHRARVAAVRFSFRRIIRRYGRSIFSGSRSISISYAHHYIVDLRWLLFAAAALLFGRTWIYYRIWHVHRRMPLLLACFLTALFIWLAENIGTVTRTWLYPHQNAAWSLVPVGKLGSWFLLLIISYALVAAINRPEAMNPARERRGL